MTTVSMRNFSWFRAIFFNLFCKLSQPFLPLPDCAVKKSANYALSHINRLNISPRPLIKIQIQVLLERSPLIFKMNSEPLHFSVSPLACFQTLTITPEGKAQMFPVPFLENFNGCLRCHKSLSPLKTHPDTKQTSPRQAKCSASSQAEKLRCAWRDAEPQTTASDFRIVSSEVSQE